jgi:hypothetical protein
MAALPARWGLGPYDGEEEEAPLMCGRDLNGGRVRWARDLGTANDNADDTAHDGLNLGLARPSASCPPAQASSPVGKSLGVGPKSFHPPLFCPEGGLVLAPEEGRPGKGSQQGPPPLVIGARRPKSHSCVARSKGGEGALLARLAHSTPHHAWRRRRTDDKNDDVVSASP